MRRVLASLVFSALLLTAFATVSLAAKPSTGCPAGPSGFMLVDRDEWWEITVEGFEIAGIPVYVEEGTIFTDEFNDFTAAVGFGDGAGLESFVRGEQWDAIDKNDNDLTCLKLRPVSAGNPGYFVTGVDDQSSKR